MFHLVTRCRPALMDLGACRTFIGTLSIMLLCCTGAMADQADLYRTKVTVTGQGEANRITGFAAALEDVLIKSSGVENLGGDRRLASYKAKASDYVKTFSYRDQFFGKPIRDEQGTRDRPFDLTVDFESDKIDGLLNALNLKPWMANRPRLTVFALMEYGARNYVVTSDGSQSDLQRDALLAAADKRGMNIVLPHASTLARSNIADAELRTPSFPALKPVAAELGGELVLVGRLVWDDRELGWSTQWKLDWRGQIHRWQMRRLTFDETFRRGIGGAAQILSGHGDPASRSSAAAEGKPH
jgi:uncharacterized protein